MSLPFFAHLPDYLREQTQLNRSAHTLAAYQRDLDRKSVV